MAFLTFAVVECLVSSLPGTFPVVFPDQKMSSHIFQAVIAFGKEKIEHILGRWQMTVHAVDDNP